jgi:hypothetical protein
MKKKLEEVISKNSQFLMKNEDHINPIILEKFEEFKRDLKKDFENLKKKTSSKIKNNKNQKTFSRKSSTLINKNKTPYSIKNLVKITKQNNLPIEKPKNKNHLTTKINREKIQRKFDGIYHKIKNTKLNLQKNIKKKEKKNKLNSDPFDYKKLLNQAKIQIFGTSEKNNFSETHSQKDNFNEKSLDNFSSLSFFYPTKNLKKNTNAFNSKENSRKVFTNGEIDDSESLINSNPNNYTSFPKRKEKLFFVDNSRSDLRDQCKNVKNNFLKENLDQNVFKNDEKFLVNDDIIIRENSNNKVFYIKLDPNYPEIWNRYMIDKDLFSQKFNGNHFNVETKKETRNYSEKKSSRKSLENHNVFANENNIPVITKDSDREFKNIERREALLIKNPLNIDEEEFEKKISLKSLSRNDYGKNKPDSPKKSSRKTSFIEEDLKVLKSQNSLKEVNLSFGRNSEDLNFDFSPLKVSKSFVCLNDKDAKNSLEVKNSRQIKEFNLENPPKNFEFIETFDNYQLNDFDCFDQTKTKEISMRNLDIFDNTQEEGFQTINNQQKLSFDNFASNEQIKVNFKKDNFIQNNQENHDSFNNKNNLNEKVNNNQHIEDFSKNETTLKKKIRETKFENNENQNTEKVLKFSLQENIFEEFSIDKDEKLNLENNTNPVNNSIKSEILSSYLISPEDEKKISFENILKINRNNKDLENDLNPKIFLSSFENLEIKDFCKTKLKVSKSTKNENLNKTFTFNKKKSFVKFTPLQKSCSENNFEYNELLNSIEIEPKKKDVLFSKNKIDIYYDDAINFLLKYFI